MQQAPVFNTNYQNQGYNMQQAPSMPTYPQNAQQKQNQQFYQMYPTMQQFNQPVQAKPNHLQSASLVVRPNALASQSIYQQPQNKFQSQSLYQPQDELNMTSDDPIITGSEPIANTQPHKQTAMDGAKVGCFSGCVRFM
ncbi:Hypothetical_protein [Hexamita inflata]|uniref:Hypothetical_protein n=1 Tax=Hexamita inflata TaxID=28002 RepID=A0AA86Q9V1_9EUKA|nr:Hypothetical protein HINF_LOCUS36562 [Hexamita inflata]